MQTSTCAPSDVEGCLSQPLPNTTANLLACVFAFVIVIAAIWPFLAIWEQKRRIAKLKRDFPFLHRILTDQEDK